MKDLGEIMKNLIDTPFGNFYVRLNHRSVDFKCVAKNYCCKDGTLIPIVLIDIDTMGMSIGDEIFVGFDSSVLSYYGGNERSSLFLGENKKFLIGLCGYEPQYHICERELHSFYMESCNESGFTYVVERDPALYQKTEYQTRVITVALCWNEKENFHSIQHLKNYIEEALENEIKYQFSRFNGTVDDAGRLGEMYLGNGERLSYNKEYITCDEVVGTYVSIQNEMVETRSLILQFSKNAVLVVPTYLEGAVPTKKNIFPATVLQCLDSILKITLDDEIELVVQLEDEYDCENDLNWNEEGYEVYHTYLFKVVTVLKGDYSEDYYDMTPFHLPKRVEVYHDNDCKKKEE